MAAADRDDKGYPPIVTVCLSDHLPGQNSPGPLRYCAFSDQHGPFGALWMATAEDDEAAGWEPNDAHPDGRHQMYQWRLRITVAQARPHAPSFDPATESAYSAEDFFVHWTSPWWHEGVTIAVPDEFDGASSGLAAHLGWE